MRRKMLVGLALAVCGAVAFSATSLASGKAAKPKWKSETLVVYNYAVFESSQIVDTDGSGTTGFENLTPADMFIVSHEVLDKPKTEPGHKQVGRTEGGVCMEVLDGAFACSGAFVFDEGRIFFSGIQGAEPVSRYAITGGTGAYRNVRGEMTVEVSADFTYATNTVKLIGVER